MKRSLIALSIVVLGIAALACSNIPATVSDPAEPLPYGTTIVPQGPTATSIAEVATVEATEAATQNLPESTVDGPTPMPMGQEMLSVYPLGIGAVWTYHAMIDYDTEKGTQEFDGEITETVVDASPAIENWVFHTQIAGHPLLPPDRWYVTKGSGLYLFEDADSAAAATDPGNVDAAAKQILAWPMEVGQMFGDPALMNPDGRNVWRVESDNVTIDLAAGHYEGCYIVSMLTNPDDAHRTFCPGVGVVQYEYHHHGTRLNQIWELVSFKPAS